MADVVLQQAAIDARAPSYQVLRSSLLVLLGILTAPLIVVWLPFALWYFGRWHRRLQVQLCENALRVRTGILFRVEKTIPLEQITDLAIYDGPVMRAFGLVGMRVETAGQTGAGGALATVVGIVGASGFRDAVLAQRDRLRDRLHDASPRNASAAPASHDDVLVDILAVLRRIEAALAEGPAPSAPAVVRARKK